MCRQYNSKIDDLVINSKNNLIIKYVFLGNQNSKPIRGAIAARKQGKFKEFHKELFKHEIFTDDFIYGIADSLGLDMKIFQDEYLGASIYKEITLNQEALLNQNIYSTPTLIFNDQILDEPNAIDIIKFKISN